MRQKKSKAEFGKRKVIRNKARKCEARVTQLLVQFLTGLIEKKSQVFHTSVWTPLFVGEEGRPVRLVAPTETLASRSSVQVGTQDAAMTGLGGGALTTEPPIGTAKKPSDEW